MVILKNRYSQKLRRIILLHFWTSNFWIWSLEKPKTSIFMISGFWEPLGTLIRGFEYTKLYQRDPN